MRHRARVSVGDPAPAGVLEHALQNAPMAVWRTAAVHAVQAAAPRAVATAVPDVQETVRAATAVAPITVLVAPVTVRVAAVAPVIVRPHAQATVVVIVAGPDVPVTVLLVRIAHRAMQWIVPRRAVIVVRHAVMSTGRERGNAIMLPESFKDIENAGYALIANYAPNMIKLPMQYIAHIVLVDPNLYPDIDFEKNRPYRVIDGDDYYYLHSLEHQLSPAYLGNWFMVLSYPYVQPGGSATRLQQFWKEYGRLMPDISPIVTYERVRFRANMAIEYQLEGAAPMAAYLAGMIDCRMRTDSMYHALQLDDTWRERYNLLYDGEASYQDLAEWIKPIFTDENERFFSSIQYPAIMPDYFRVVEDALGFTAGGDIDG